MAAAQSALRTIHVASPQSRQQFSQIANVVEYDYGSSDSEDQLTTDDKPISHFPLVLKIEKSLPQNGQIDDLVSSVNCVLPNWMEPLKSDEDVEKDIVPAPQPAVPLTEMPSKYHVSGISDVLPSSNDQPASVEQDPPIVPEAAEVEDFIIDENADPTNTLLQDDVQEPTVPWTPLKRKRTQVQSSHTPLKWLDLRSRDLASAEEESTELSPKTAGNVDELEIIETNAVAWTPRKKATNTPSKLKWQLLSSKKEFAKLDLELMSSSSLLVEFEQTIPAVEDATPLALLDGNAENTDDLVNVSSEHDDNATATSSREPAQEPVSVTVLLQGANEGDDNAPQDISISV